MAKKHQKHSAAHAWAACWKTTVHDYGPQDMLPKDVPFILENNLENNSDCGYVGGVSIQACVLDMESELVESSEADTESLCELDGDELEGNLRELQEKEEKGSWDGVFNARKTSEEWQKVERNRNLGYNGLSHRSQRRQAKAAWDGKALHDKSKQS
ncbi:hypothetical protein SCLCIDRAFT_10942 [Scleroderma citrinum Foug A]|uniref:Uncharacterized protein n=1 Tax=Scleroderma citrinum Foug A TaxID=1036808 RepID=A0A0C2Z180_9AGAM|nr:hypothetical protein SCLCIDRAFT_10942 [Scleroderma citrinum Foug A]